jgi:hypothetical protein
VGGREGQIVCWQEEIQDITLKNDQGIIEFSSLLQSCVQTGFN